MPHRSTIKQQFLKKWLVGLRACASSKKNMDIFERKRAIKLSADLAMASARNGTTCWSRAIIAKSARDDAGQALVRHVFDPAACERLEKHSSGSLRRKRKKKMMTLQKIRRRVGCHRARKGRFARSKVLASSIAKRLVRKRTKVLRSLVPGGEIIEDEVSLIEETLDYISFLRAQVDVMRCLASCR